MRKTATLLAVLLLFCAYSFAQTKTVSGKVTDEKGLPVPFVSVQIKGKKSGVSADADGLFSLKAETSDVLIISSTDINTLETAVGAGTFVNIQVTRRASSLTEVVVTALGIKRKPKELGYATSSVNQEQITNGKNFNLAQSLSGKVSGLAINNTSASVNATPRIVLRGLRSVTGDNTALIVLDGVAVPANTINYINPNDVDRVDVLKGGQAATLFGSEGVNGAIVITTKKGSQKPEITVTHSSNAEMVAYMPKFQNTFGSGSAYGANSEENFHSAENQQYGPAFDGSLKPLGRTLPDGSFQLLPYSSVPGMRDDFWTTGYTAQTDVSYRAGDQNSNFFASYQNLSTSGVVPKDKFNRNVLRMNAGRSYGKVNLSFDATYTWDNADRTNTDFYFFALNTSTWVPTAQYKDWRNNKFADPSGYYNDYYNNPWWLLDNVRFTNRNNYFNGNAKIVYKVNNDLSFTGRLALATTNFDQTTTSNPYTYTGWAKSNAFVNYFNSNYDALLTGRGRSVARTAVPGSMGESASTSTRINGDLFGQYNRDLGDFSLKLIAGMNIQSRRGKSIGVSTAGLGAPDLFNFSNTSNGLFSGSNELTELRKIGGYGDLTLGYKGFLFLHGAYRNDYTSVFYDKTIGFNAPHFSTYGGDVSFILFDAFPSLKNGVLDNVKLRASYNKNGNDNLITYGLKTIYPSSGGFPYSGLVGSTVGNTAISSKLVPETVKTAEVGIELGFFGNRLNLEASYYRQTSDQQILEVRGSAASGTPTYRVNAAKVTNQGAEFDLRTQVVRSRDWNASVSFNYSYVTNVVDQLYVNGMSNLEYQAPDALASINATQGLMFPSLRTTVLLRDSLGRVIINPADGWPLRGTTRAAQGNTLPKHYVGVGINVSWRNFTLIANAEYRGGYVVYHDLGTDMTFTGSGAMTAIYNRDVFVWPNSSYDDGTGKYVPNTNIAVDAYKAMYQGYGDLGFTRGMTGVGEFFYSSGAFWKLRDASITYDFPKSVFGRIKAIKGISLTAWGRNLVTILPDDNWFTDPEFSNTSGNSLGINTSINTPPTRQLGGTLKVTF